MLLLNAIFNIVLLCILYLVYNYGLKRVFLDYHRQKLFEYRDKLFDLFHSNDYKISENDYRKLRDLINVHIRYAHRTNILSIVYYVLLVKRKRNPILQEFDKEFDKFNENIQIVDDLDINIIYDKFKKRVALYNFYSQPILSLIVIISLIGYLVIKSMIKKLRFNFKYEYQRTKTKLYAVSSLFATEEYGNEYNSGMRLNTLV